MKKEMKKVKIVFAMAFISLAGAIAFFMAFLFVPEPVPKKENVPQISVNEEVPEVKDEEDEMLKKEAEAEIQRFKDSYDMEISLDEMMKQLKIRNDYTANYGRTYELEEVFLAEAITDPNVGDVGDDGEDVEDIDVSFEDMVQKIQRYKELYDIDESRYATMTAEEELAALEEEYGPLEEEVTEEEIPAENASDSDAVSEESLNEEALPEETATEETVMPENANAEEVIGESLEQQGDE